MNHKKRGKKAVSPLIATILLIGIVIVGASIIMVYMGKFIPEHIQKYGERVEDVCDRIEYNADIVVGVGDIGYDVIINNQGNDNIHQINIKFIAGGRSVVVPYVPEGNKIIKKQTGIIDLDNIPNEIKAPLVESDKFETIKEFTKIEVSPVLLGLGTETGQGKLHECNRKSITLNNPSLS